MTRKKLTLSIMTGMMLFCTSAKAEDETPQFNFSATGASNYIFRGISQTNNNPAAFGKGEVDYQQFYAGVGAENVEFNHRNEAEYDLSAGWRPTLNDFNFDLGVIRYGYTDQPAHVSNDTLEYKAAVSHAFGAFTVGTAVFYTGNYFGTDDDGIYYEANAAYKITDDLSASGAVGRQHIGVGGDYTTWNIGGDYAIVKNVALDLRYYDTDTNEYNSLADSHLVAAIKVQF